MNLRFIEVGDKLVLQSLERCRVEDPEHPGCKMPGFVWVDVPVAPNDGSLPFPAYNNKDVDLGKDHQ